MTLDSHGPKGVGHALVALALFVALFTAPALAQAKSGYLGVHLQDLDDALKAALDLDDSSDGVLVSDVVEDSPAEEAGLQQGDVIVEFDGAPAKSVRGLTRRVRRADSGDEVRVKVMRKGRAKTLEVTLGEAPRERSYSFFSDDDGPAPNVRFFGEGDGDAQVFDLRSSDRGVLGVRIEDLDEDLGHYFGADKGALVLGVHEDSAAEKAGLKAGDVIVGVDGEEVEDTADLHAALAEFEPGDEVEIAYLRDKKKSKVEVELGEGNAFSWVLPEGNHFRVEGAPHGRGPARLLERLRVAPHIRHRMEGMHEDRDGLEAELDELREQLDDLREQLQQLQQN